MKIEGTATISLEVLDDLRNSEKLLRELQSSIRNMIEVDAEEYDAICRKAKAVKGLSGEKYIEACEEAERTLKITISEKLLRKLVHRYINNEEGNAHYMICEMTEEEFEQIPLILSSEKEINHE